MNSEDILTIWNAILPVRKHKFLCMLYITLTYQSNHNLLYFLGIPKAQPKAISSSQLVINVLCFFHCLNIALSPFLLLHVLETEWTVSQKTLIKKKVHFATIRSSMHGVLIRGPERFDMCPSNNLRVSVFIYFQ